MRAKIRVQPKARNESDLIRALENMRTRFVVAAALEQKSTTRKLWGSYLETEARLRRCLKLLRLSGQSRCAGSRQCILALEMLSRRSNPAELRVGREDARHFQRMLQEVLALLEKIAPD